MSTGSIIEDVAIYFADIVVNVSDVLAALKIRLEGDFLTPFDKVISQDVHM